MDEEGRDRILKDLLDYIRAIREARIYFELDINTMKAEIAHLRTQLEAVISWIGPEKLEVWKNDRR